MNLIATETLVVASILTDPHARLGPSICTALAYSPSFWESPEAGKLAKAVYDCVQYRRWVPKPANVARLLEDQYKPWVNHPSFKDGVPLGIAEVEAASLLKHYQRKRIGGLIGDAYSHYMDKPQNATLIGKALIERLQAWI